MTHEELYQTVIAKALEFGFLPKNTPSDTRQISNPKGDSVIRKNLTEESLKKGGAYFGLIRPEQELAGTYYDFSFVVFPDRDLTALVVGLAVGSSGFQNDYQLASQPGLRRIFAKLNRDCETSYFKDDFSDKDTTFIRLRNKVRTDYPSLFPSVEEYKTCIVAAEIVDMVKDGNEGALHRVFAWLATYARAREVGTQSQMKAQEPWLPKEQSGRDELEEIRALLMSRRFVVLQGAPGTGKTFSTQRIASDFDKVFFDQFHAETSYSDFIGGLRPVTDPDRAAGFEIKDGILTQAVKYAADKPAKKVLLIIDEINRANLSNVLGPVFYLFEPGSGSVKAKDGKAADFDIDLNGTKLAALPRNLYVIATMNTADRSLAVVDFALRRRFAWYTLRPHVLSKKELGGRTFDTKLFAEIDAIFARYATDAELSLQPGHSYFIYDPADESARRAKVEYELMPLIKEYLAEGYLEKARTEFTELFLSKGCRMYE